MLAFQAIHEATATPESMGISTAQYRGYDCAGLDGVRDAMRAGQIDPSSDTMMRKVYGWHVDAIEQVRAEQSCDVAASASTDSAGRAPADKLLTLYYYCYLTDTDARKTVASQVFARTAPAAEAIGATTAFATEFNRVTDVHGVHSIGGSTCTYDDTLEKAAAGRARYRSLFSGISLKFVDVYWEPTSRAAASSNATALTPAAPVASTKTVAVAPASSSELDAFKLMPGYRAGKPQDVAEVVRILSLPVVFEREVGLDGAANIRAFVDADPFFEAPRGSEKFSFSPTRSDARETVTCQSTGRTTQSGVRMEWASGSSNSESVEALGGLLLLQMRTQINSRKQPETYDTTKIDSVYGQPFPLAADRRFGLNYNLTVKDTKTSVYERRMSCAVAPGTDQHAVTCVTHGKSQSHYLLSRHVWHPEAGCFSLLGQTRI